MQKDLEKLLQLMKDGYNFKFFEMIDDKTGI
jgi:hypothetical protein